MQVVRRIEHAFTMFEAFLRVCVWAAIAISPVLLLCARRFSSDPANALPVVSASVAATITYVVVSHPRRRAVVSRLA